MAERVWERFLTEQDKATLTGKPPRKIIIVPNRIINVVI